MIIRIAGFESSRVTSEGVLLEEYIGKNDFCHCFLLHFWNKLAENNNFDVKTVRKFLILTDQVWRLDLGSSSPRRTHMTS